MIGSHNNTLLSIYQSPRTVFTIAGIGLMINESRDGVLSKRLNYYVREGKLLNPRRGIYAKNGYNSEELACQLYTPTYLSLEYVLQKAGIVFQYDSAMTCVSYLSRTVDIEGREYRYRKIKGEILVAPEGIKRNDIISIATPERAFLDVLYLNSEYYFDNLNPLDYNIIQKLLPIYENKRIEARVKNLFGK